MLSLLSLTKRCAGTDASSWSRQVLGRELLVPPPPPHHHHDHDGGDKLFAMTENEAKHIRKALRELAAMA